MFHGIFSLPRYYSSPGCQLHVCLHVRLFADVVQVSEVLFLFLQYCFLFWWREIFRLIYVDLSSDQ